MEPEDKNKSMLTVHNKFENHLMREPTALARRKDRYKLDIRQSIHRMRSGSISIESLSSLSSKKSRKGIFKSFDADNEDDYDDEDSVSCQDIIQLLLMNRPVIFFTSWLLWLVVGTIYYSMRLELNFSRALYMAVNVGYSIGWGDIQEDLETARLFSTLYVIVGASFIGAALGFFAEGVVAESGDWYFHAQKNVAMQVSMSAKKNRIEMMLVFIRFHWVRIRIIFIWFMLLVIGTVCAANLNSWPYITSLYFSVSTMSTGGLVSLPDNSPDYYYLLLGLYAAVGIPIMGTAMAKLAGFFVDGGNADDALDAVTAVVTEDDIANLHSLGLEDGDGMLDKAEYILLILLRLGEDPELISFIEKYFRELDKDQNGRLSIEELQSPRMTATKQALKHKFRKRAAKIFAHNYDDLANHLRDESSRIDSSANSPDRGPELTKAVSGAGTGDIESPSASLSSTAVSLETPSALEIQDKTDKYASAEQRSL